MRFLGLGAEQFLQFSLRIKQGSPQSFRNPLRYFAETVVSGCGGFFEAYNFGFRDRGACGTDEFWLRQCGFDCHRQRE